MVTPQEAQQIAKIVAPTLTAVLAEYDFGKYPAAPYAEFQTSFAIPNPTNTDIENAMIWKWGHWGKPNFPQHHRNLIHQIQNLWPTFLASGQQVASANTFQWWKDSLNRNTTYITVAYITHLIHHNEPTPIIDQHNFRAMNYLVQSGSS